MTYEIITAGPATFLAAAPVATKMPAPITAPMPRAVRETGPRTRLSWSALASLWTATSGFLTSNRLMGGAPWVVYLNRDLDDFRSVLKVVFCWVFRRRLAARRRALLFCMSGSG